MALGDAPSVAPNQNPPGLPLTRLRAALGELLLGALGSEPVPNLPPRSLSALPPLPDGTPLTIDDLVARFPVPSSPRHRAGGVRTTLGLARGNLLRKLLDEQPGVAGVGELPEGFERVAVPGGGESAPLFACIHPPRPGRPVVIVLHGLFDSKLTRYARFTAQALAASGLGVLIPDQRWHGELFLPEWLSALGQGESADLLAWGRWTMDCFPHHPLGLIGFSLGSLTLLHTLARPEAAGVFRAGGLAFSPPGDLARTVTHLDRTPLFSWPWGRGLFPWIFRQTLRRRLRASHFPTRRRGPFAQFAALAARQHGVDGDPLLAADPRPALSRARRPVLAIASANDPVFPRGTVRALEDAARDSEFARVIATPHGGHIGHLSAYPDWVGTLLAEYFDLAARVGEPAGAR